MRQEWKDIPNEKEIEWHALERKIIQNKSLEEASCPICKISEIHFFIFRFSSGSKRAGLWFWCGNCYTYAHYSGIAPSWWENIKVVPLEELEHSPDWLNSNLNIWEPILLKNLERLTKSL